MLKGYYTDIEQLPLQGWIDCNNGDLRGCRTRVAIGTKKKDALAWASVYNDFLRRVPRSEEFTEFLENLIKRANLQTEYIVGLKEGKRDRFKLNAINDLTAQIQNFHLKGKSEKTLSITKILNLLSKKQGYQLRIKDLTTLAYFELLNDSGNG